MNLHVPATELRVATADGAGAGRFLTLALLDALAGSTLAAIRIQAHAPAPGAWSIDFGFHEGTGEQAEVIRAGLNQAGHVVAAELLRTGPEIPRAYRRQRELGDALRAGHAVESMQLWTQETGRPSAVVLHLAAADEPFVIDLDGFDRLLDNA